MTLLLLGILVSGSEPKTVFASDPPPQKSAAEHKDKLRSQQNFTEIRHAVETLRGKKFKKEVPVFNVSQKYLRSISDHDLDKDYPGAKLHQYEALLAWVGLLPPNSNLKTAFGNFFAEELAGLYDSDTKEMCIPFPERDASRAKPAEKKLASVSTEMDELVLAHEFTHALEDQYWPLDVPEDNDTKLSTDRGTAHEFVSEGSAMREMIEAVPAQVAGDSPSGYFLAWNVLHSGLGESLLGCVLENSWKSDDVLADNVPSAISRLESMPYSFGYSFCTDIMRKWGLDGLDYIYEHPPVSSEQVMHPRKAWEWRDFPVQIDLPNSFGKTWTQSSIDTIGEAGIAVFFGSQFTNLNYGTYLARGWDGDHAALYENEQKEHLMVWASAWDSTNAAGRFVNAFLNERQNANHAITKRGPDGQISWTRPDGRVGTAVRDGKNLVLIESDEPKSLEHCKDFVAEIRFTQPPQDAERAALNSPIRRFNPFWAVQQDGDYKVARSFGGLLSRQDRNSVGAADTIACGLIGQWCRTKSFHKWQIGAGLLARHESEERRGFSHTTFLPLGVLASRSSATLPQSPKKTIGRFTILWGIGATSTKQASGAHTLNMLPFGILAHVSNSAHQRSFHILGTGVTRTISARRNTKAFHLFGIPIARGAE